MITKIAVTLTFLFAAWAAAQDRPQAQSSGETQVREIQKLLDAQVAAWNRGDLEAFMAGYWDSPELTFFSNDHETHGWQETLDRYRQRYQGDGHAMGQLNFEALRITPVSEDAAFVRGQFHLKMPDGKDVRGMFTLVLRKFPTGGWKIVHDHSSG